MEAILTRTFRQSQSLGSTTKATIDETDDDGKAIVVSSLYPILVLGPAVDNQGTDGEGADAEDVDWEIYVSDEEIVDVDDRSWRLLASGTQDAGDNDHIDALTDIAAKAAKIVITSSATGVDSEGVEVSLTVVV